MPICNSNVLAPTHNWELLNIPDWALSNTRFSYFLHMFFSPIWFYIKQHNTIYMVFYSTKKKVMFFTFQFCSNFFFVSLWFNKFKIWISHTWNMVLTIGIDSGVKEKQFLFYLEKLLHTCMTFQNMFQSWKPTYAIIWHVCFNKIKKQMHTYNCFMCKT